MGCDAVAQDNDGPADNAATRLIRPTVLHEGRGVERNPRETYYWIKVAALQGIAPLAAALSDTQKKDTDAQAAEWMEKIKKMQ